MIVNSGNKESVIYRLMQSTIQYYLTGSRFFGNERDDSDWDYFTANGYATEAELRTFGFEEEFDSSKYEDKNICSVFRHTQENVHVQLVNNVERKIQIQDSIKRYGAFGSGYRVLDKDHQKNIWALAYDLLRNAPKQQLTIGWNLEEAVKNMYSHLDFIYTIKMVRALTGYGLKEAKEYVERIREKHNLTYSSFIR